MGIDHSRDRRFLTHANWGRSDDVGLTRVTSNAPHIQGWRWLFAPRMRLMRADLAAAAGQREEARARYAKVLDLFLEADPELQPTVARIRAALRQ